MHPGETVAKKSRAEYDKFFREHNGRPATDAEYERYLSFPETTPYVPQDPNRPLIPSGAEPGARPPTNDRVPRVATNQTGGGGGDGQGIGIDTPLGRISLEDALKFGFITYATYVTQRRANEASDNQSDAIDAMVHYAELEEQRNAARFEDASKLRGPATGMLLEKLNAGPRATPDVNRFQDTANPFRAKFGGVAARGPTIPPAPIPPPDAPPLHPPGGGWDWSKPPATPPADTGSKWRWQHSESSATPAPAAPMASTAAPAIPPAPIPAPNMVDRLRASFLRRPRQ